MSASFEQVRGESLDAALSRARDFLQAAGVASPWADAQLLAAYALEEELGEPVSLGRVQSLALLGQPAPQALASLVEGRGQRIPLQHLTGQAPFRSLTLEVGPGVFIPRPETELLVDHALAAYRQLLAEGLADAQGGNLLLDLCSGSGAIAAALATEEPGNRVLAVELDPQAAAYTRRNTVDLGVEVLEGDALELPEGLEGQVALIATNPPYIPRGAYQLEPEVAGHDPELALYGGGAEGLDFPLALLGRAAELLKVGGYLIMEHDDSQGPALAAAFAAAGFERVESLQDYGGKPRYTAGYKASRAPKNVKE